MRGAARKGGPYRDHLGRCVLRAQPHEPTLRRCVRPKRGATAPKRVRGQNLHCLRVCSEDLKQYDWAESEGRKGLAVLKNRFGAASLLYDGEVVHQAKP